MNEEYVNLMIEYKQLGGEDEYKELTKNNRINGRLFHLRNQLKEMEVELPFKEIMSSHKEYNKRIKK